MNTLVKIDSQPSININTDKDIISKVKGFNILTINTTSFKEMALWDDVSKKTNIPLYILVSCGQFGFTYISLGNEYTFIRFIFRNLTPINFYKRKAKAGELRRRRGRNHY